MFLCRSVFCMPPAANDVPAVSHGVLEELYSGNAPEKVPGQVRRAEPIESVEMCNEQHLVPDHTQKLLLVPPK